MAHRETYQITFGALTAPDQLYVIDQVGEQIDLGNPPAEEPLTDTALIYTASGNIYYRSDYGRNHAGYRGTKSTLFDLRNLARAEKDSFIELPSVPIVTIGDRWQVPGFRNSSIIQKVLIPELVTVPFKEDFELPNSPFQYVEGIQPIESDEDFDKAVHVARLALSLIL